MRLFAGIELDDVARAACANAQDSLRRAAFEARYEAPEKLHATLAFLGNVPDESLPALAQVVHRVASHHAPFDLVLDRLGAFPNERRPRIVFVGTRMRGAEFRTLAHDLRHAYAELGFTFEDDAVAHVTIARVKGGSQRPLPAIDVRAHRLHVQTIVLFRSAREQDTTRYEIAATAPLRPPSLSAKEPRL